jgi:hypothetical protein
VASTEVPAWVRIWAGSGRRSRRGVGVADGRPDDVTFRVATPRELTLVCSAFFSNAPSAREGSRP